MDDVIVTKIYLKQNTFIKAKEVWQSFENKKNLEHG